MVSEGLRSGALRPGKMLLDATSGNTGIAYAMIGASQGFPVRLCVPSNVTVERKRLLHAYGAELIFTDPMDGSDGAIREARKQVAANPDAYFYPDQYNNDANWRAHYDTTGPEILAQTEGRITHFVAGLGTSGTFMGTGRRLREANPSIKLISFQPDSPLHGLEGLKHMETAIVPGHLRSVAGGRGHARQHRRRVYDGAASGARRGAARGHFGRRGAGRRPESRREAPEMP